MIALDEALRRITADVTPLRTESVELAAAAGRVLALPVRADRDNPSADRSAMDGFALRAADVVDVPARLQVIGEVRAGVAPAVAVEAGEAVRIFTGALIPPGADAVVMVERTREDRAAGQVVVDHAARAGEHIRPRGQDRGAGDLLLSAGRLLQAAELAALASVGATRPLVYRRPRVGVLSTGDEIVEPGVVPAAHQVRNSNGPMLVAQARALGCEARCHGVAGDRPGALRRALQAGLAEDVLLVTGGVSVGDYDLVAATLEALGLRLWFHGVAMKPGKPVLAGRCGTTVVVGLPGNPVSSFACFAVLVAPLVRRLGGVTPWDNCYLEVRLTEALRCRPGRVTYHLARLDPAAGGVVARAVRTSGSGDVLALARANGFVVTAAESAGAAAGQSLPALPWPGFPQG